MGRLLDFMAGEQRWLKEKDSKRERQRSYID